MRPIRSFSDRRARRGERALVVAGLGAGLLAALLTSPAGHAQVIPPPPPNPGDAPKLAPADATPHRVACPRCGYLCDEAWRYCIACGWDRWTLVGAAEDERLRSLARATVRVTVPGRPNRHATAFPYGSSGLLLTNARALIGADESQIQIGAYNNGK